MSLSDPRIRTINIRIEVDRWNWTENSAVKRDKSPLNITNDVRQYTFSKSIKSPMGTANLVIIPQSTDTSILDVLEIMDVVRIYEFDALKFIGYIRRISYRGSIEPATGKPQRDAVIVVTQMGGILQESMLGLGLGRVMGKVDAFVQAASDLYEAIANAVTSKTQYKDLLTILINSWFSFIRSVGGTGFTTYINEYTDFSNIPDNSTISYPRQFDLYTGTEESLSLWEVALQLVESPLNELWVDNGPRSYNASVPVTLSGEKSSIVFRKTPFNGTVKSGVSGTTFNNLPSTIVDGDHVTRFDLGKSRDEIYSVYGAIPPAFQFNEIVTQMLGFIETDFVNINKYLYKPLVTQLFYTRAESQKDTVSEGSTSSLDQYVKDISQTLKAWYSNNDRFYSGAITMMVPTDPNLDPKIGTKIVPESIDGAFYVEGVAHSWSYQGPLVSTLSVTRGWNYAKDIPLKFTDRIFRRGVGTVIS